MLIPLDLVIVYHASARAGVNLFWNDHFRDPYVVQWCFDQMHQVFVLCLGTNVTISFDTLKISREKTQTCSFRAFSSRFRSVAVVNIFLMCFNWSVEYILVTNLWRASTKAISSNLLPSLRLNSLRSCLRRILLDLDDFLFED